MELEAAKKLIKEYMAGHDGFVRQADIGERYYRNRTDILFRAKSGEKAGDEEEDPNSRPLRNADNRIPHNFHGILVNQKAAYMFTYPPLFDTDREEDNKKITRLLGGRFAKVCKTLCVKASNAGVAWLHYWEDENGKFNYGVVDSQEVIPVWTHNLDRELCAALRTYREILDDGKGYVIYEIWTDKECESFCHEETVSTESLMYYSILNRSVIDIAGTDGARYAHGWGRVPFIPFFNNDIQTNDLQNTKALIDTYDSVYSGFVNDLEDIQEIIFILSGYGGTELGEFLQNLKKYKAVNLDEDTEHPGLSTLTIDIPVEAREKLLAMTRKEIFEQGQGIDPQPENYGNASGEALKFMYSLLELKAGLMETEFRLGFEEFIQAVCGYHNIPCDNIQQTWTRNMIRSDAELATMCTQSVGVISQKTIVKNHPFVENAEAELRELEKEKQEQQEEVQRRMYDSAFGAQQEESRDGEKKTDSGE